MNTIQPDKKVLDKLRTLTEEYSIEAVSRKVGVSGCCIGRLLLRGDKARIKVSTYQKILTVLGEPEKKSIKELFKDIPERLNPDQSQKVVDPVKIPEAAPLQEDSILSDEVLLRLAKESLRTGRSCEEILLLSIGNIK